tara:strand:+ start:2737 stop:3759 length:1023 start_codon:yes stop_codon:yes gene_type:complete
MQKFILKVLNIIFLTFVGLVYLSYLNNSRLNKIQVLSEISEIFINPKFRQSIIDFKLNQNKKEISIIGSSRTAGFEKGMFKNKNVFNYSMIVNSIEDILKLINKLDLNKKDTLIIGLDQWNFNSNYKPRNTNSFIINKLNLPFLLFDKIKTFNGINLIGKKSIDNFSGFRNDGSYFDGKRFIIPRFDQEDYLFKDTFHRIKNGNKKFEYGSKVDSIQLIFLDKILRFCKEKEIQVYGFSPPFAPSVIEQMKSGTYNYSYIEKSVEKIKELFSNYKYHYKDFTVYDSFDDSFYLDGSHCNRNVYYQILKDLNIPVDFSFDNKFEVNKKEIIYINNYFKKID